MGEKFDINTLLELSKHYEKLANRLIDVTANSTEAQRKDLVDISDDKLTEMLMYYTSVCYKVNNTINVLVDQTYGTTRPRFDTESTS